MQNKEKALELFEEICVIKEAIRGLKKKVIESIRAQVKEFRATAMAKALEESKEQRAKLLAQVKELNKELRKVL